MVEMSDECKAHVQNFPVTQNCNVSPIKVE